MPLYNVHLKINFEQLEAASSDDARKIALGSLLLTYTPINPQPHTIHISVTAHPLRPTKSDRPTPLLE